MQAPCFTYLSSPTLGMLLPSDSSKALLPSISNVTLQQASNAAVLKQCLPLAVHTPKRLLLRSRH